MNALTCRKSYLTATDSVHVHRMERDNKTDSIKKVDYVIKFTRPYENFLVSSCFLEYILCRDIHHRQLQKRKRITGFAAATAIRKWNNQYNSHWLPDVLILWLFRLRFEVPTDSNPLPLFDLWKNGASFPPFKFQRLLYLETLLIAIIFILRAIIF